MCRYLFIRCDNEQGVWDGVQDPDPAVPPADVQKEVSSDDDDTCGAAAVRTHVGPS